MSSPTSGSPAASPARKGTQAPAWLVVLLTPFVVRHVAREMVRKYPGLTRAEVAEKMRADVPSGSGPEALEVVERVLARLPATMPREAGGADASAASLWVLLAANLLPVYGVFFLDWSAFALVALYWAENVAIGALNAARMTLVDPSDAPLWLAKLFMVPFFCLHYGFFTLIHGAFVFSSLFGAPFEAKGIDVLEPALQSARALDLYVPLGVLAGSHLFSFLWNFLFRGEYLRASLPELMARPYRRVIVMHLGILAGGAAAAALGSPEWALVALMAVKVALDVAAHRKEHRISA